MGAIEPAFKRAEYLVSEGLRRMSVIDDGEFFNRQRHGHQVVDIVLERALTHHLRNGL